ncbi:NAD(P)H-binding protein [Rhodococcus sp. Q]|uniref:SDR family oxidoreductase n=1 Tax=Rhodococcus sp. Q TaxID=2502252 RepID=UPI0010F80E15|nr:NAD(P)H-binding protein [Rhodococcus sp. Q]
MTTVLVVGGTGTAGSAAAAELASRGAAVRVLSRHAPATLPSGAVHYPGDLLTGAGLAEALAGVDVVVSAANGQTKATRPVFTDGARTLTAAARDARVRRLVLLSIVGVDRVKFAYYGALVEQERIFTTSGVDTAIVRCTQFHSLVRSVFAGAARIGILPAVRGARFQSIAPVDVGRALADTALAESPADRIEIGGPELLSMRDLAYTWKRVTGSRAVVVGLPVPGEPGRFLREGRNLTPENRFVTVTFAEWLTENRN